MGKIKLFCQKFLDMFLIFFKIINENIQVNILNSISKDKEGNTIISISPLTSNKTYQLYPHQIINNPFLKYQFRKQDIKIVESLVISEGDIFITEREYKDENSYVTLQSIINMEKWKVTESEILMNQELLMRINKRFFKQELTLKNVT